MNQGEVCKDFLRKFPDKPSRTLARWIVEQYGEAQPELTVEGVRSTIRVLRGKHGVADRNRMKDEFFHHSYELPIPSTYDSSDFRINEEGILAMADLQIPFHDNRAIISTIKWAKRHSKQRQRVEAILLNADVLDCYQLSFFAKDPRERTIESEIEDCKDFLELLQDEFGVPVYFKYGNHEERYERYMWTAAKELAGVKTATLEEAIDAKKFNCKIIRDKRTIKIGHLNVIHGHELGGGITSPVNPARTLFLKCKAPTLGAHHHTTSEHSGRAIDGKLITCWSMGALCDLKPKYRPINEWNHGFAFVSNDGKNFRVLNLRIEKGIVY